MIVSNDRLTSRGKIKKWFDLCDFDLNQCAHGHYDRCSFLTFRGRRVIRGSYYVKTPDVSTAKHPARRTAAPNRATPSDLVSVVRVILHYKFSTRESAPGELVSVE